MSLIVLEPVEGDIVGIVRVSPEAAAMQFFLTSITGVLAKEKDNSFVVDRSLLHLQKQVFEMAFYVLFLGSFYGKMLKQMSSTASWYRALFCVFLLKSLE